MGIEQALADTGALSTAGRARAAEYTWAGTATRAKAAYDDVLG